MNSLTRSHLSQPEKLVDVLLSPHPTLSQRERALCFAPNFSISNSGSFLHNSICMSPRCKIIRRILKHFLPIVLVIVIAFVAIAFWLVRSITRPPRAAYLVTPQSFSRVTGPMLQAQDVTWKNHDGTQARGWLIRGAEGAPAVILLH